MPPTAAMRNLEDTSYQRRPLALEFIEPSVEARYRKEVLDRTFRFIRGAWFLIPILGGAFGLLDHAVFHQDAPLVQSVRAVVLGLAVLVSIATFSTKLRRFFVASGAAFILLVGSFCAFLVAHDVPSETSPYFVGLFLAFSAVFSTPGIGFVSSSISLAIVSALFLFTTGVLSPVASDVFLQYAFFLPAMMLAFGYGAWIIERFARQSFATSERLQHSLDEIATLSGLLPICSACKKIRDDEGYWQRIETFISAHSEAQFSHGICPDCATELYPDLVAARSKRDKPPHDY